MSYASVDDPYGRLTQFRERLSREVRQVTGKDFEIFQDRKDIKWGQQWRARIEGSLETVTFLIAILTPSFFASEPCREEVGTFLQHEARLKRSDLLLGVHYVECPLLLDEAKRANHELAKKIADRQYVDWRDIRHETFNTPAVGLRLERWHFRYVTPSSAYKRTVQRHPQAIRPRLEPPQHPRARRNVTQMQETLIFKHKAVPARGLPPCQRQDRPEKLRQGPGSMNPKRCWWTFPVRLGLTKP